MHISTPLRAACRVVAAAALVTEAVIHLHLAGGYDLVKASISQGTLFRIEAAAAILAAVLVLLWRHRIGDIFALAVAAGGLAAVLLYRYVDVGKLGPFPDMYEPIWFAEKIWSAASQAVAVVTLAALLVLPSAASRNERGVPPHQGEPSAPR